MIIINFIITVKQVQIFNELQKKRFKIVQRVLLTNHQISKDVFKNTTDKQNMSKVLNMKTNKSLLKISDLHLLRKEEKIKQKRKDKESLMFLINELLFKMV